MTGQDSGDHDGPSTSALGAQSKPSPDPRSLDQGEAGQTRTLPPRHGRLREWRKRRRIRKALWSKLHRRLVRTGIAFGLIVILLAGSLVGYFFYQLDRIHRVNVNGLSRIATSGIENILLVGSTDRCAVKSGKDLQAFIKECEAGVNGVNSDVVMILRVDPSHHRAALLSIPRDTFVPNARQGGLSNKIDAALANGPSQLVSVIQADLGIPINHYIVLNFETFANIVTVLGGIRMEFPTAVNDLSENPPLHVKKGRCLHISGLEALALVRSRHMQYDYSKKLHEYLGYDGSGDLGRITRVHLFLRALANEVEKRGLGNPLTNNSLLNTLTPDLTVETTFGTGEMLHLLLAFRSLNAASIPEYTLPIVEDQNTYLYKGYNYGDVVFPVQPQDATTIRAFMNEKSAPKASPSSISVSVVDGTGGTTGVATATQLGALGYHVIGTGSAPSVGPVSETVVIYRKGDLTKAQRVLSSLRGAAILAEGQALDNADVTIVTGSDFAVDRSTRTATKTTAVIHDGLMTRDIVLTAAAVLVPARLDALSSVLAPPTPSQGAIPWYDPRACPPPSKVTSKT